MARMEKQAASVVLVCCVLEDIHVSYWAQAAEFWKSGECRQWLAGASSETRSLASTVNGPMLELLANLMGAEHKECVQYFREGMPA